MVKYSKKEKQALDYYFPEICISNKTILILGSTSFVGLNLVRLLINLDMKGAIVLSKIILQCRDKDKFPKHQLEYICKSVNFEIIECQIQAINQTISKTKIHYLFNFLNYNDDSIKSRQLFENLNFFKHVIEFCSNRSVENFLFTSSGAAFGNDKSFIENDEVYFQTTNRNLYYGLSKVIIENLIEELSVLNSTSVRLFSFIGPYMNLESTAGGQIIKSVLNNTDFNLNNKGKVYRSYMHSTELSLCLLKLALELNKNCKKTYNLGSNKPISIAETYNIACEYLDQQPKLKISGNIKFDDFYVPITNAIEEKIRRKEFFDMKDKLSITLDYYKNASC